MSQGNAEIVLGFLDEVWWSRFSQPKVRTWMFEEPLRMVQREADKEDKDATRDCLLWVIEKGHRTSKSQIFRRATNFGDDDLVFGIDY